MRGVWWCTAAVAWGVSAVAWAHDPVVAAEVVASSERAAPNGQYAGWRALHGETWCEGAAGPGVGETLTLRFGRPVLITAISATLLQGDRLNDGDPLPHSAVDVDVEAAAHATVTLHAPAEQSDPVRVELGGAPVRELTLRIRNAGDHPPDQHTCLENVQLFTRGDRPLLVAAGMDERAVRQLHAAYEAIEAALTTCKRDELAQWMEFPLRVSRLTKQDEPFPSVTELSRVCRSEGFSLPPETTPPIFEGTSQVRYAAASPDEDRRWLVLEWKGDGWKLVEIGYDTWD